jgi:riboflavin synthase
MTDLWISTRLGASGFALGESIAVDGACLTVVERTADTFKVQAAPETLRRTTLGGYAPGTKVNLERALRLSDRLGGHLVLGHVDAVARILERTHEGGSLVLQFELPPSLAPFFIDKGSVTVDGISLTVNSVSSERFSVQLIPETQERTTLAAKQAGATVNLEADLIGKYVARLHGLRGGQGITEAQLKASGFGSGS